jgi:hypothetical protein
MTAHNYESLEIVCPSCGRVTAEEYEDAQFCEHCGATLPKPALPAEVLQRGMGDGIELRPTGRRAIRAPRPRAKASLVVPILLALLLAGLLAALVVMVLVGRL